MSQNLTQKLIEGHLEDGRMEPGAEIALRIDQTLTQDATGTLVMLELEAMGLDRVRTDVSVQYVDHNLVQADFKNADDHLFLESACRRFGVWYSPPGNGVSHPVHMERFGRPGATLLGSDSHTCAGGALGMLAVGAGGLEVALAMAGEPFHLPMPEVWGVRLHGELPDWVSAKDVILEMLRRHDVDGGLGRVVEYHGPGLESLGVWDRHVIANMGAELGATTTVFPSDEATRRFLESQGRGDAWTALAADDGASWDHEEDVDLSSLEPLVALPSSPGNVVPVREVAGREIYQAYVGSSANPGYRDFAVVARVLAGRRVPPAVSLDLNPASRQILGSLLSDGHVSELIRAGGRLHQVGCNGCIGMGQAPATGRISMRTVPRNFPGRSGTREDAVHLCSPETAAASALKGRITDPRTLDMEAPRVTEPGAPDVLEGTVAAPPDAPDNSVELVKGPNVRSLPELDALAERLELPVLLAVGDDVSTDEILPAGTRVLPFRSNVERIADFCFDVIDDTYAERARKASGSGHAVVGGSNYGQGSSREHAALAPRSLGLRLVIAKSFARIHRQNLVNFGVLPLTFTDDGDRDRVQQGDELVLEDVCGRLRSGDRIEVRNRSRDATFEARHDLSPRELGVLLRGGLINWKRERLREA